MLFPLRHFAKHFLFPRPKSLHSNLFPALFSSTASPNGPNDPLKEAPKETTKDNTKDPLENSSQSSSKENTNDSAKETGADTSTTTATNSVSFREKLKTSAPLASRALEFGIYAWKLTFPSEKYHDKFEQAKQRAREIKKAQEEEIKYAEEDLEKMQQDIPEWKRQSLVLKEQEKIRESLRKKVGDKFKNKFNETKFAKDIYKSDSYKEFETFKKEMHQFKEDFKDHIENSPNAFVQTSLGIYSKVSNESTVARAIKEMRNLDPSFDIYELEEDAKGIFEAAYTTFLQGNLELLEKMCGEMALGYFKVLLRKMEAEKTEPKYKYLWQIDPAFFSTALIPEKKLPVFIFTIKTQEIHCFISKIDKRIVDGDDERLMNYEYSFAITPHQNPDIESVGHGWEIIELQPRQVVKMLV